MREALVTPPRTAVGMMMNEHRPILRMIDQMRFKAEGLSQRGSISAVFTPVPAGVRWPSRRLAWSDSLVQRPEELAVVQLGIQAACGYEFRVRSPLHDRSLVHHEDDVGVPNG